MVRFVAAVSKSELVRINVLDALHRKHVEGMLDGKVNAANVAFHLFPTNDAWCRDHGAIFVTSPSDTAPLAALDFRFNAWGDKYPPYDLDDAIAAHLTRYHGVFAPASRDRSRIVPGTRTAALAARGEVSVSERRRAMSWAQRLKRVFATPQGALS